MENSKDVILTTPDQLRQLVRQELKSFADELKPSHHTTVDRWYDVDGLSDYLPGKPAKQTIYGYVSSGEIPFHKTGKRLAFLKSEIDKWLQSKRRKTNEKIKEEALRYTSEKRKGGVR